MTDPSPTQVEIDALAKKAVADWLDEPEGFSLRAERMPDGSLPWLETAWKLGYEAALVSLQGELAATRRKLASTEINRSGWEDSARINKHRADEAEAELAAMKKRDEASKRMDGMIAYSSDLQRIIEDLCNNRDIRKPETSARFHYDMAVASRASRDAGMSATDIDFSANIARVVAEESAGGAACGWRHCTGCYESEDGYAVGHYPFSPVFGCEVGAGCSECGGLGVIWHYYSAQDLDAMQAEALSTDQRGVADRSCRTKLEEAKDLIRQSATALDDFARGRGTLRPVEFIVQDLRAFLANERAALQEAPAPATEQRIVSEGDGGDEQAWIAHANKHAEADNAAIAEFFTELEKREPATEQRETVTDVQVNAFSREWSRLYPGRGMPDASQVRSLLEAASVSVNTPQPEGAASQPNQATARFND